MTPARIEVCHFWANIFAEFRDSSTRYRWNVILFVLFDLVVYLGHYSIHWGALCPSPVVRARYRAIQVRSLNKNVVSLP